MILVVNLQVNLIPPFDRIDWRGHTNHSQSGPGHTHNFRSSPHNPDGRFIISFTPLLMQQVYYQNQHQHSTPLSSHSDNKDMPKPTNEKKSPANSKKAPSTPTKGSQGVASYITSFINKQPSTKSELPIAIDQIKHFSAAQAASALLI